MDYNLHTVFPIEDRSYLPLIKSRIKEIAQEFQLGEEEIGRLNIIATELVTNLVKFGEKGREILVKPVNSHNKSGVEILSIDQGRGAKDPLKMLEDGYSTSGTKGEGLGAIKRLSDEFDLYTHSSGTIVFSRVFKKNIHSFHNVRTVFEFGGIMVAKANETVCGDQWFAESNEGEFSLAMIDGLGHGPDANKASTEAINIFKASSRFDSPEVVLDHIHSGLKKTRGAVGMIVRINNDRKSIEHCGVGNIGSKIIHNFSPESNKSLILFNGILGLNVKRMHSTSNAWDSNKTLVMHSDGLNSRWDLQLYPGVLQRHPTIIAAVLYRDFNRKNDDITVVVARTKKASVYV